VPVTKYYLGEQIKKNQIGGTCGMYGEQERCRQDCDGETEGKRPIGRPSARWETNINMSPQEMERGACTGFIWLRIGTGGALL
jgi:hypothetical protein